MSDSNRITVRTAVFVLLYNDDGEVLLQQRANTGFLDGYWDMPSGHIEPDESIVVAAQRELAEEVCIEVEAGDLTLINIAQNYLDVPYINFTFLAQKWRGEPAIGEPEKVSAIGFFATDNLPEKCSLGVRLMEKHGFPTELSFSVTNEQNFAGLMHEPFDRATWGKK